MYIASLTAFAWRRVLNHHRPQGPTLQFEKAKLLSFEDLHTLGTHNVLLSPIQFLKGDLVSALSSLVLRAFFHKTSGLLQVT